MHESRCATCGYPARDGSCPHCGGDIRAWQGGRSITPGRRARVTEFASGFVSLPLASLRLFHDRAFVGRLGGALCAGTFAFALVYLPLWFLGAEVASWWVPAPAASGLFSDPRAVAVALVVCWQIGTPLALAISGSFLDGLAGATETAHGVRVPQRASRKAWASFVRTTRHSARVLSVALLSLPLTTAAAAFRPTTPLAVLATGYLSALVLLDLPAARRGLGPGDGLRFLLRNWSRACGLGLAYQVWSLLPVFNLFLLLPAGVVAAHEQYLRGDKPPALASPSGDATVDAP